MDSTRLCSVEECSRYGSSFANDARVCLMHYKRWKRLGAFDLPVSRARAAQLSKMIELYLKGHSTTEVGAIAGIDSSNVSRRLTAAGVEMRPFRNAQRATVSYYGAHIRVRKLRGKAREHHCECGRPGAQWAYMHNDPDELTSAQGAYSLDSRFYVAKCVPCHKRMDLDRIAGIK